jgi:glycosyltransferase involved in cell wall biosynthesis
MPAPEPHPSRLPKPERAPARERLASGSRNPGDAGEAASDSAPAPAPGLDASVVIPARNECDYICAALESVTEQTCGMAVIEAVVCANGCQDATVAVSGDFGRAHAELKLRVLDDDSPGLARAKNHGAAAATGRVLIFLDADSRLAPDLVECVLERERQGMPAGSLKMVADSDDLLDRGFFGVIEYGKRLFRIKANMLYCTREIFWRHGGFDESMNVAEDRDLLVRLQRAGVNVVHATETCIATSPRRLHILPFRLGIVTTLGRWALAHAGIGRRWSY